MSRFSVFLIVLLVVVASALARPEDPAKPDTKVAEKKGDEKVGGSHAVESSGWTSLFTEGTYAPIISGTVATLLVVGGLGLGLYYYFYYVAAQQYSSPVVGQTSVDGFTGYNAQAGYGGYGQQPQYQNYGATGRAIRGASTSFSFDRVLDMISMAQELYEKFDFQSLDCQKKALCELQQRTSEFGETGRQLEGTFLVSRRFVEALEDLPMPKIIQTYLKEYKEALLQGKNSNKDCGSTYPKCSSSVRDVFVKYSKKIQKL